MNQKREELLQGLEYVRDMLNRMTNVFSRYVALERKFRGMQKEIDFSGVKGTSKAVTMTIAATLTLFYVLTTLIYGNILQIVPYVICAFIIYKKRGQKSKLKGIAWFLVAGQFIITFFQLLDSLNPITTVLIIILVALVIAVEYAIITKKNKQTREINAESIQINANIKQQRQTLLSEYEQLQNELFRNTSAWYPERYYVTDAVEFFINAVRNYRADTVKELVNLYEEAAKHQEIIANQVQQTQLFNQLVEGQQASLGQLRFANMLNIINTLQLSSINANTRANTNAVNGVRDTLNRFLR